MVSNVLIRKLYLLGKLMRQQWKSKEELEKLRNKKLRFIINHVYSNNRFYHRTYKDYKNVVYNFKGFKDLQKLPVIKKEDVQKYGNEMLGRAFSYSRLEKEGNYSINGYTIRKTSGSSGQPLSAVYDSYAWDWSEATYARAIFASGHRASDVLVLSYPYPPPKKDLFNYFGIMRKKYIMPSLSIEKQLSILLAENTKFTLHSFPSILLMLSKEIRHKNHSIGRIISIGESLVENTRKKIEDSFRCKIYNHYGAMEFNRIAWECDMHEGLHINADTLAVELIKDGEQLPEGERGEIIITGLHNFAFPLIRYMLDDLGKISSHKCSCGRGLPLMSEVIGRQFDFIVASDGRLIPPVVTDTVLNSIKGILQFKLEQGKDKKLKLYLIKKDGFEGHIQAEALQKLSKLDPNAKVKIILTNMIKRNEGGKLSSVISKCDKKF